MEFWLQEARTLHTLLSSALCDVEHISVAALKEGLSCPASVRLLQHLLVGFAPPTWLLAPASQAYHPCSVRAPGTVPGWDGARHITQVCVWKDKDALPSCFTLSS